jgi:hypothetical protein
MITTEDTESKEEVRVEGQKLKVKEKVRCSMVTMLPTIPPLRAAKGAALRSG